MALVSRRTFLKSLAAVGGGALHGPYRANIDSDELRRAARTLLRARGGEDWHCAHEVFVAGCLGPWARWYPEGRRLLQAMESGPACCAESVSALVRARVYGVHPPAIVFDDPLDPAVLEDSFNAFLRWRHEEHVMRTGRSPSFPRGETPAEVAFDLLRTTTVPWLVDGAPRPFFEALGYGITSRPALYRSIWGTTLQQDAAVRSARERLAHRERVQWLAREHWRGKVRSLARQVLGELDGEDLVGLLAFEAAEEAGLLDALPRHGAAPMALTRRIFRRAVEARPVSDAGAVGAALLRDRTTLQVFAERLKGQSVERHARRRTLACLVTLDYARHLPALRRSVYTAGHTLPRAHCTVGDWVFATDTDETFFPFACPSLHEGLEHLSDAELRRELRDAAGYEGRLEATIELAHRLRGRALAQLAGPTLRSAAPEEVARLLQVVEQADPRTAGALARPLLGHRQWVVRVAAAGTLLRTA
ncbi:MAG: hypothetical protein IT371_07475 [Deltaproteobacteria bacterium]|nr:hypothetical protein [Deltaproteobacteria bacterium]